MLSRGKSCQVKSNHYDAHSQIMITALCFVIDHEKIAHWLTLNKNIHGQTLDHIPVHVFMECRIVKAEYCV